jgi:hypothetical protein
MCEAGSAPATAAAIADGGGRRDGSGRDHNSAEGAQHLRAAALLAELRSDPRLHRPLALRERLAQAAGSNVRGRVRLKDTRFTMLCAVVWNHGLDRR